MVDQELADHVLRTFAAVPLPESVLVVGEGSDTLADDLSSLGFQSVHRRGLATVASDVQEPQMFGWVVVVLRNADPVVVEHLLANVRVRLRTGGWVIIGLEETVGSGAIESLRNPSEEVSGFAVAEDMAAYPGGHHVILRLVADGDAAV